MHRHLPIEDDEKTFDAIESLMRNHPDITGIFALDDDVALRTVEILRRLGIGVPDRISMLAPGDMIDYSLCYMPQITTMRIDTPYMGRIAGQMMPESRIAHDPRSSTSSRSSNSSCDAPRSGNSRHTVRRLRYSGTEGRAILLGDGEARGTARRFDRRSGEGGELLGAGLDPGVDRDHGSPRREEGQLRRDEALEASEPARKSPELRLSLPS